MSVMKYFYMICEDLQQELLDGAIDMDEAIDTLSALFPSVNREFLLEEFNSKLDDLIY